MELNDQNHSGVEVNANVSVEIDDAINVFRFKFTPDVMEALTSFAKIHRYDDRKTYKESWGEWVEDNTLMIRREMDRLNALGYNGNVMEKMYKASRYYFRNKTNSKNEPTKRRKYISIDSEILDAMDNHIQLSIKEKEIKFKPSVGYSKFCELNVDILKEEITRMCNIGLTTGEITDKIKKTYKNRYFMITRNMAIN